MSAAATYMMPMKGTTFSVTRAIDFNPPTITANEVRRALLIAIGSAVGCEDRVAAEASEPLPRTTSSQPPAGQAAQDVRPVEVVATDFAFDPNQIRATPGQKLKVTLVNRGSAPHNIEFELPSGEVEFEKNVPAGESRSLTFTAPQKAGEYVMYCPVGNHRERGMVGKLIVEAN